MLEAMSPEDQSCSIFCDFFQGCYRSTQGGVSRSSSAFALTCLFLVLIILPLSPTLPIFVRSSLSIFHDYALGENGD